MNVKKNLKRRDIIEYQDVKQGHVLDRHAEHMVMVWHSFEEQQSENIQNIVTQKSKTKLSKNGTFGPSCINSLDLIMPTRVSAHPFFSNAGAGTALFHHKRVYSFSDGCYKFLRVDQKLQQFFVSFRPFIHHCDGHKAPLD